MENAAQTAPESPEFPTILPFLPDYQLVGLLGRGGMSHVFDAVHRPTGQRRAVKVVHEPSGRRDLSRFRREAAVLTALDHPHIVRVYEVGEARSAGWMSMERADRTVWDELEEAALPPERATRFAVQAARALEAAHEAGVVHRDVKPSNLLLRDDRVRVADFGIARVPGSRVTMQGTRLGSRSFMAPEQEHAPQDVTGQADVYALAATLYACLTRKSPRGLYRVPLDHPRWRIVAPERLRALLKRAMAALPTQRPSLVEFRRSLLFYAV
jgi:serine/threonine-protein kinase